MSARKLAAGITARMNKGLPVTHGRRADHERQGGGGGVRDRAAGGEARLRGGSLLCLLGA